MRKRLAFFILIVLFLSAVFSCHKKAEVTAPVSLGALSSGKAEDSVEPSATSSSQEKKEDIMVATVNGTVINQPEVDREIDNLMRQFGSEVPADQTDRVRNMLKKEALENVINRKLLQQKADTDGVKPDEKAVDEKVAEIAGLFPNKEQFRKKLDSVGLTEEDFRKEVVQDLKIERLLEGPMASIKKVTDEDVETFYRNNPKEFQMQEQVRASHILISVDPGESEDTRTQKRQKLTELRQEIMNGADFAQLASQHSTCPSKSKGGDLSFFERGRMVQPFEDAAFSMQVNEVSDIVQTQFGYHLIKVTDHKSAQAVPLEKVKDKVASYLNNQKKMQVFKDYIEELRKSAKIEYSGAGTP